MPPNVTKHGRHVPFVEIEKKTSIKQGSAQQLQLISPATELTGLVANLLAVPQCPSFPHYFGIERFPGNRRTNNRHQKIRPGTGIRAFSTSQLNALVTAGTDSVIHHGSATP